MSGAPKNVDIAIKWFEKAADAGDTDTMNSLGSRYETGDGIHNCSVVIILCIIIIHNLLLVTLKLYFSLFPVRCPKEYGYRHQVVRESG